LNIRILVEKYGVEKTIIDRLGTKNYKLGNLKES
jgi:hypothetical protein